MDIAKQIDYWKNGAKEDIDAAEVLIGKGKTLHGLFFTHLALEKVLKSLVVKATGQHPDRIHNLILLAKAAGIGLTTEYQEFMAEMNRFCLHGRYPEPNWPKPGITEAAKYLAKSREIMLWLIKQ